MSTDETRTTRRLEPLDGLRGVAAVSVMIFHYLSHEPQFNPVLGAPVAITAYGREGVRLFFIISGFVIVMSLRYTRGLSRFATARFIRLYPTYWLCMILTFIAIFFFGLSAQHLTWSQSLLNVTMLQPFFNQPSLDGAYWTLAIEISFYVQAALLWRCGLLAGRRLLYVLYIWLTLAVLAQNIISAVARAGGSEGLVYAMHLGVDNLPWFMVGIAALAIFEGRRHVMLFFFPVITVVASGASLSWEIATFGGASFLLVMFVLFVQPLGTQGRLLQFLGRISYPLYLLHSAIGLILLHDSSSRGIPRWIAVPLAILFSVCLAWLVTICFDEPIRRYLRSRIRSRSAKAQVTAKPVPVGSTSNV